MNNLFVSYPFIISDMDGTIINKDLTITKNTIDALRVFQLISGYKLSLASGRPDIMIKEYVDILNLKMPVISCNGALIRDPNTNEILFEAYFSESFLKSFLPEICRGEYDITIHTADMIYASTNSPRLMLLKQYNETLKNKNYEIPFLGIDDYAAFILDHKIPVMKISLHFNRNQMHLATKLLELVKPFSNEIDYVTPQEGILDLNVKGINKGNAFKKMCSLKKINPSSFIFYGDNFNDLEIAKQVGFAVAVGNAVAELKSIANVTINCVEQNGVAEHIKNNVLTADQWEQGRSKLLDWKNKY